MTGMECIYVSPEEFVLMMEFSGGGDYVLFGEEGLPRREDVLKSVFRLFQKKYILEKNGQFLPDGEGLFFKKLHDAPWAVLFQTESESVPDAAFYPAGADFYMVEYLMDGRTRNCRISRITRTEIRNRLIESGVLEEPFLSEEDTGDMERVYETWDEEEDDAGEEFEEAASFTKIDRKGKLLAEASVLISPRGWFIRGENEPGETPERYTTEALNRMMDRCFGKDTQ